jgi:hypothetical protein
MMVGLLPDVSMAEILLNNLAEADFNLADVSVVTRDPAERKAIIAEEGGPLKGATLGTVAERLTQAGLTADEARLCRNGIAQGKVLIVMTVAPEAHKAAKEMLQDHAAELIKE